MGARKLTVVNERSRFVGDGSFVLQDDCAAKNGRGDVVVRLLVSGGGYVARGDDVCEAGHGKMGGQVDKGRKGEIRDRERHRRDGTVVEKVRFDLCRWRSHA